MPCLPLKICLLQQGLTPSQLCFSSLFDPESKNWPKGIISCKCVKKSFKKQAIKAQHILHLCKLGKFLKKTNSQKPTAQGFTHVLCSKSSINKSSFLEKLPCRRIGWRCSDWLHRVTARHLRITVVTLSVS